MFPSNVREWTFNCVSLLKDVELVGWVRRESSVFQMKNHTGILETFTSYSVKNWKLSVLWDFSEKPQVPHFCIQIKVAVSHHTRKVKYEK